MLVSGGRLLWGQKQLVPSKKHAWDVFLREEAKLLEQSGEGEIEAEL